MAGEMGGRGLLAGQAAILPIFLLLHIDQHLRFS
jgi:hypothetical protein